VKSVGLEYNVWANASGGWNEGKEREREKEN